MMNGMEGCGGDMMAMMGLFGLLVIVLLVLGILYLARALNLGQLFSRGGNAHSTQNKALELARERYARGEIDQAEFERLKGDLT